MSSSPCAYAIDIGGTHIKAGILTQEGDVLALQRVETPAQSSPETVVQHLFALQRQLCQEAAVPVQDLAGVGISIAAFITAGGDVTATAHLSPQWIGYNLKNRLSQEIRLPYYFTLDTPAAAFGEAYYGAGQGIPDFVYVTVSTGIGAGIFAGGRYMIGGLGWAGGIGHIIIDETSPRVCSGCGNHGCLETFAAKQGVIATAREVAQAFPDSQLGQHFRQDPESLDPRRVFQLAEAGDQAARQVYSRVGHGLGIGLTNLVDVISPTRVVIGGGISLAGDLLLDPARRVIQQRAFPPQNRQVELVVAELGDLSGMYGAAAMVFNDIRVNP
jgi:glucokinase